MSGVENADSEARRKPRPLRRLQTMRRLMSEMPSLLRAGRSSIRIPIPRDFRTTFSVTYSSMAQPSVVRVNRYISRHDPKLRR